jgi:O-antigen/teichoic acid export membrane protein
VYALGNMALKASGLILIPLYLNPELLSQRSYGLLALIETTAQIAIPVAGLGITSGLLKFTADPELSRYRQALPFTALLTSLASALVVVSLFWVFAAPIADRLLEDPGQTRIVRLLAVYIGLKIVSSIPLTMIRVQERAGLFAAATLAETLVLIAGVWYTLSVRHLGLEGVLWAFVGSAGTSAVLLGGGMLARIKWRVQPGLVSHLIRFGVPLAISGLALPFLHVGDRYLLKWLSDVEEVAIYDLAARYSGILNMLFVQSMQLAFSVIGLKSVSSSEDAGGLYRRTFRHFVIWTGWAALALSLAVYDAIDLISQEPNYLRTDGIVTLLSLGLLFYGIAVIAFNVLIAKGKTRSVALSIVVCVLLNGLLNLAFIPSLNGAGAALATLISYIVLAGLAVQIANRKIPIDYPWRVLVAVLLLVITLYAAGIPSLAWDRLPRIGWRAFLILLYPAGVIATGIYSMEEIRTGWQQLKQRWKLLGAQDDATVN